MYCSIWVHGGRIQEGHTVGILKGVRCLLLYDCQGPFCCWLWVGSCVFEAPQNSSANMMLRIGTTFVSLCPAAALSDVCRPIGRAARFIFSCPDVFGELVPQERILPSWVQRSLEWNYAKLNITFLKKLVEKRRDSESNPLA